MIRTIFVAWRRPFHELGYLRFEREGVTPARERSYLGLSLAGFTTEWIAWIWWSSHSMETMATS